MAQQVLIDRKGAIKALRARRNELLAAAKQERIERHERDLREARQAAKEAEAALKNMATWELEPAVLGRYNSAESTKLSAIDSAIALLEITFTDKVPQNIVDLRKLL